jgi:hypothetical protein
MYRNLLCVIFCLGYNQDLYVCWVQIGFHQRSEVFRPDNQLDVVWKMYRVRSLVLSVSAAQ